MLPVSYPVRAPLELINSQGSLALLIDQQVFPFLMDFLHIPDISTEALIHSVRSGALSNKCFPFAQDTIFI